MSTPLAATHRIQLEVRVQGLTHKMRLYCHATPSLDPSGYDVSLRAPYTPLGASLAIDQMFTLLAPMFSSTRDSFGQAIIQEFSGGAWLPLSFYTTSVTPSGTFATTTLATQFTWTFRDTGYHKVRNIFFESFASPPAKFVSSAGMASALVAYLTAWQSTGNPTNPDPFFWVQGRSGLYVNSWISLVLDTNDKVRRARGLA